jgi:hypothetical protein
MERTTFFIDDASPLLLGRNDRVEDGGRSVRHQNELEKLHTDAISCMWKGQRRLIRLNPSTTVPPQLLLAFSPLLSIFRKALGSSSMAPPHLIVELVALLNQENVPLFLGSTTVINYA